jgi:hypothetical protein
MATHTTTEMRGRRIVAGATVRYLGSINLIKRLLAFLDNRRFYQSALKFPCQGTEFNHEGLLYRPYVMCAASTRAK